MANERVLIVEDDRAVARGLHYGLQAEGFEVFWAEDGAQALELASSSGPHIILLDIRLPGMSGLDVCRELRNRGMRQPVLMLTARDDELDKVLGLEMGADDYIVKPYSLREVIARVRAQLRRAYGELAQAAAQRINFGPVEIDLESLTVRCHGRPVDLTPTEFRLLRFLASNPGRPFTRASLIETVWGYDSDIGSDRTVDVHMRHLREKLEDDAAAPRWLVTVRGIGYKFAP